MCRVKDLQYPITTTVQQEIAQDMLGLNSSTIIIDHADKDNPDNMWYNKAYHWDRKSRYWQCTATIGDK